PVFKGPEQLCHFVAMLVTGLRSRGPVRMRRADMQSFRDRCRLAQPFMKNCHEPYAVTAVPGPHKRRTLTWTPGGCTRKIDVIGDRAEIETGPPGDAERGSR